MFRRITVEGHEGAWVDPTGHLLRLGPRLHFDRRAGDALEQSLWDAFENFLEDLGMTEGVTVCKDPYEAAEGADGLLLVTEWRQYRSPDFKRLKSLLNGNVIIDGRNQWDRKLLEGMGFNYQGIGREAAPPEIKRAARVTPRGSFSIQALARYQSSSSSHSLPASSCVENSTTIGGPS